MVCIVGKKKSGKTTHLVALAAELTRRGRRVMTVKHGHGFVVDRPGTDSWRHRHEGGALRVVLAGPEGFGVLGDWPSPGEMELGELVDRYLSDAELVLVEGFKLAPFPRIEIFRAAADPEPLYTPDHPDRGRFLAVVTDSPAFVAVGLPVLSLSDPHRVARLADLVERAVLEP